MKSYCVERREQGNQTDIVNYFNVTSLLMINKPTHFQKTAENHYPQSLV